MEDYFTELVHLLDNKIPFVSIILVDVAGSVPHDRGGKMLVTEKGLHSGSVGGGRVEKRALDEAMAMLARPLREAGESTKFVEWSLNRDLQMTCGGSVKLFFETVNSHTWKIFIFGAGHVAGALISILRQLDCLITCVDSRLEWLNKIPDSPRLQKIELAGAAGFASAIPEDAYVLLMTMGHSTDFPVLHEILLNKRLPYLGVIGSLAKRAVLIRELKESGIVQEIAESFRCPIGLNIGNNTPMEIAISIVSELLAVKNGLYAEGLFAKR